MNYGVERENWSVQSGESNYWIVLESNVLSELYKWKQLDFFKEPEACGILLGERRGKHLWVTALTTPFQTDIRTPTGYTRAVDGHQQFLDAIHKKTNGRIQYLGEWHTHPEVHPSPSLTDYMQWARTSNSADFYQKKILFMIVGISSNWIGIHEEGQLSKASLFTKSIS